MFQSNPTACPPDHDGPFRGGAGDASVTLHQACAALLEALSELTARHSELDGDHLASASDEQVADALDAARAARQRSERIAEIVLQTRPTTAVEAAIRREAISVYLTNVEVDQLTRQSYFERDTPRGSAADPSVSSGANPYSWIMPWKTWLGLGSGSNSA